MGSLFRRAGLCLDTEGARVAPLAGTCAIAAPAALGVLLQHVCASALRDRALVRRWLSDLDGVQA